MISVNKAQNIIRSNAGLMSTERIDILLSLGRILAEDIKSKNDIPPFNNSAMDGFVLNSQSVKGASRGNSKILKVIEDLPAGSVSRKKIKPNQTIRIMTGAALPLLSDCVVKVEDVEQIDGQYIKISKQIKKGENVRRRGEDIKKQELVLTKGTKIRPQESGLLAALGIGRIRVYRRVRVGILSTGDELVDLGQELARGKIRNSNSYSLRASVLNCGAIPIDLGIVSDVEAKIRKKIVRAINLKLDILLISGGVSVGDYDYVKKVLSGLGAEFKFWKVKIRPGKPLLFVTLDKLHSLLQDNKQSSKKGRGKVLVFGMPGNPVSALICFEEFVRLAIMQMCGVEHWRHQEVYAVSQEAIEKKKGLRYFLRVKLEERHGRLFAKLTGPQGSGILKSLVLADGIMIIPEIIQKVKKGDPVKVQLIR